MGLVILGSDKTHLTVYQGDKECHAVYMTCGNIKKALRTKVGAEKSESRLGAGDQIMVLGAPGWLLG